MALYVKVIRKSLVVMKKAGDLRNLVKSVRNKSFPYEKREPEKRNWSHYDDAQVNEIADILETTFLYILKS